MKRRRFRLLIPGPKDGQIVHLAFVTKPTQTHPCVVCRQPKCGYLCERCGAPMHGDCHLYRVATEDERDRFLTVPQDMPGANLLIMLCPGCRQ